MGFGQWKPIQPSIEGLAFKKINKLHLDLGKNR